MEFVDIAYPLRIGANGDLQLCQGYDKNIEQSLMFIIDSYLGEIPAFTELGLPLDPFVNATEDPLTADLIQYYIPLQETRIKSIYNIVLKHSQNGECFIDFDYIAYGTQEGHFSKKYFRLEPR